MIHPSEILKHRRRRRRWRRRQRASLIFSASESEQSAHHADLGPSAPHLLQRQRRRPRIHRQKEGRREGWGNYSSASFSDWELAVWDRSLSETIGRGGRGGGEISWRREVMNRWSIRSRTPADFCNSVFAIFKFLFVFFWVLNFCLQISHRPAGNSVWHFLSLGLLVLKLNITVGLVLWVPLWFWLRHRTEFAARGLAYFHEI